MTNTIEFEDIAISMPELQVTFRGKPLHVSLAQLRLLMILLSMPYGVFRKVELMAKLQVANAASLITLVHSLRILLDQQYIVNERGEGYSFADRRALQIEFKREHEMELVR